MKENLLGECIRKTRGNRKAFAFIFALTVLFFCRPALAEPGEYVCNLGANTASGAEEVLKNLKCDKAKPFSVAIAPNGKILACCVEANPKRKWWQIF